MNRFTNYCDRKKDEYEGTEHPFDDSALSKQFITHYNAGSNRRVKVKGAGNRGEDVWGFIGITTGWKPTFLLMRREGQMGSSIVLSDKDQIVGLRDKR